MSIRTRKRGSDINLLYAEGWARQPPAERRAEILARPTPVPNHPTFRRRVTLKDPKGARSARQAERSDGALPLLPLLEQLSKQIDLPIVAQCDYRPRAEEPRNPETLRQAEVWLNNQLWLGEPILDEPLAKALDLLCADFEYEWAFKDGAIALRHRRWFLPEEERMNGKPLTPAIPRTRA